MRSAVAHLFHSFRAADTLSVRTHKHIMHSHDTRKEVSYDTSYNIGLAREHPHCQHHRVRIGRRPIGTHPVSRNNLLLWWLVHLHIVQLLLERLLVL